MPYLAQWKIKRNPVGKKVYKLKKTMEAHHKHLEKFAGSKLLYYKFEEIEIE